jgi:RNA polymerase sigma factor (sigma-70 family)
VNLFSSERTDAALIAAIRAGGVAREQAAQYLIKRHIGFVYKVQRKLRIDDADAKDAFTDAVIAVIQQVENGSYRGENKLSSFLYQIFYFKSVDILRKLTTNSEQSLDSILEQADHKPNAQRQMENNESFLRLSALIDRLDPACKQLLLDWGFWGYSIQEIAQRMEIDDPMKISRKKYKCLEELRELTGKSGLFD